MLLSFVCWIKGPVICFPSNASVYVGKISPIDSTQYMSNLATFADISHILAWYKIKTEHVAEMHLREDKATIKSLI